MEVSNSPFKSVNLQNPFVRPFLFRKWLSHLTCIDELKRKRFFKSNNIVNRTLLDPTERHQTKAIRYDYYDQGCKNSQSSFWNVS